MCDSAANSESLAGEPSISSTPPLILLQSEEETIDQKKATADSDSGEQAAKGDGDTAAECDPNTTSGQPSSSAQVPSSNNWSGTDGSNPAPSSSALPGAWNLEHDLAEDKNLFSVFSEEQFNRLEDVLSSEEVASLLQQTDLGSLNTGLADADSVGPTPSSSNTSNITGLRLPDTGQLSDDSLKLDLFDNQSSDSALPVSLPSTFIQDTTAMSAAASDHAYALPSTSTESTMFSPRKSARIKQRMDDGKNAFESDSDFEYYFTPRRNVRKDHSEQSDLEKTSSSPVPSSPSTSTTKQKQPKRRSTRIVDLENREKAEKILQENRQKEQEAKAALQKQSEEGAKENETVSEDKEAVSTPPPAKRGRKPKMGAGVKGKKGKQPQDESQQESEDSSTPTARRNKAAGKASPPLAKGKMAKKKKEAEAGGEEEDTGDTEDKVDGKPKEGGKRLKKKTAKLAAAGKTKGDNKAKVKGVKGKKAVKISSVQQTEDSSGEDDIPLKAFAKKHKNEDSKEADAAEKPKKKPKLSSGQVSAKPPQTAEVEEGTKKKLPVKSEHRQRTVSDSEGKGGVKQKDKPAESPQGSAQRAVSKGDSETNSKLTEKTGDRGTGTAGKVEEGATSVKPVKHKHRKSEEIIIDPTVTDLFKPDGVIPTEHMKEAVELSAKEGRDLAQVSTGLKKSVHGTPVGKNTGGRTLSVESKTTSRTPQGRSLSLDSKSAAVKVTPNKEEDKKSGAHVLSEEAPKGGKEASSDKKDSSVQQVSLVNKGQAAAVAEHKKTVVQVPASVGKETANQTGHVSVKVHKEQIRVVQQKEHHSQSHTETQKHPHLHQKEEHKSAHLHEHVKPKSAVPVKKEDENLGSSQVKEERKSLFELLARPEKLVGEQTQESAPDVKVKKRKHSSEKKHSKGHKERKLSKDDGHDSGDLSYEDDVNDSDWEPTNDTETLYCICKKPHGNRFMICCDACGEWYHGQCVGVTKQEGQQMEIENKDYICPVCFGKPVEKQIGGVSVKAETETIHPQHKKEKAPGVSKKIRNSTDDPKVLKKPLSGKEKWVTQKCVVNNCKRTARLGSVFCSNSCIVEHARNSLRQLRTNREKVSGHKITDARPSESEHVMVTERRTGRVLSGSSAPTEAQLELWLQTHPSFEVMQPDISNTSTFYGKTHKDRRSSHGSGKRADEKTTISGTSKKGIRKPEGHVVVKEEKKEQEGSGSKSTGSDEGPDQVRLNVRKSLRDALARRAEEADDIVLSSSEIKRMALRIEEELFKVFGNTGHKYRAKFRSLLFNIKDQKNKGLFRKILTRKIRASHLVKMSTEELASKELAKWRKMENKHTLAMIEQTEKEALKEGQQHIRKKTHKGEVEVEEEDMSTLVTHMEEQKSTVETKTEEEVPVAIVDTTDQHRAHLFDLNCKICTGKILPPVTQEPVPKKLKVSHEAKEGTKDEVKKEGKKKEVTIKEVKVRDERKEGQAGEVKLSQTSSPESVTTPTTPTTTSQVTVRSPDSALQSGLDAKHKFTPSGPMIWKGFISMQDFAKFFTSAYRVSGPVDRLGLPDTLQICGRIGPEQMWDYLGKIRQAGSRDISILRFIPGSDDEKVAYVHLYSYLNSRSRCGVVGSVPKHVKDLYIVPLASHGKIPQVLLPFDGPGLEGSRPHMLIGIVVRQKMKRPRDSADNVTAGKSTHSTEKSQGVSDTKKSRIPKSEETEAYSPTADGDEDTGTEALYIPTPTTSITRAATSSASSSSSAASSSLPHSRSAGVASARDAVVSSLKQSPKVDDAEPYSPGNPLEEGDAPYDPEDAGQFDEEVSGGDTKPEAVTTTAIVTSVTSTSSSSTAATVAPTASSSQAAVSTVPLPSTDGASSVDIDNVMHKISATTDPKEISSLMVAVLAKAKDSTEQQRLLATLTSKVEEQKKHQVEKQCQDGSTPADTELSSSVVTSVHVTPSVVSAASDVSVSVSSTAAELGVSSSATVSSQSAPVSVSPAITNVFALLSSAAASTSASLSSSLLSTEAGTAETRRDISAMGSAVSSVADSKPAEATSHISSLNPDADNMPLALKALMEDLKGNTQMVRAVDKRTERERREREKREALAKEAEEEKEEIPVTIETPNTSSQKEPDSFIPGLGGAKDFDSVIPGLGEVTNETQETVTERTTSSEVETKLEEVTSSTDQTLGEHLGLLETSMVTTSKSDVPSDTDLRQQLPVSVDKKKPNDGHSPVSAYDQDDRISVRPSLPAPVPPPSHSTHYPPQPSPFMMPAHPQALPSHSSLDVSDIDHRRHIPPPPMYPRLGPMMPSYPRASQQPPPPGTELMDEGDVDMRHSIKRSAPHHGPEPPPEKFGRADAAGLSHLVPPLPPLPPQPPPPLPPLPSAGSGGDKGVPPRMEHYDRSDRGHRPHSHEHWHRSQEGGHDYDHRQPHHSQHSHFSHRSHRHHHPGRSHSPSSPHHYRHEGQDRDDRHRRDRHFHRDRH